MSPRPHLVCTSLYFQGQKSEKGEATKEANGVAEEEEEDDDEEDESSDPDIEEEIQASTQQDGPGKNRRVTEPLELHTAKSTYLMREAV